MSMLAEETNLTNHEIIAGIDDQIARLERAKALLSEAEGMTAKRAPGHTSKAVKVSDKRGMSADARARISAAQEARWFRKN